MADCCGFALVCSGGGSLQVFGGRGLWGLASCRLCVCVGALRLGLAWLALQWCGAHHLFGVSVLVCPVPRGVACHLGLGPAGGFGQSSFLRNWGSGGNVPVFVAVVFCCLRS